MWAIALEHPRHFELLSSSLKKDADYEIVTTPTGALVAKAPSTPNSESRPHFFLVDTNPDLTKHAISWVHKNLHPQAFVSADFVDDWRTGAESENKSDIYIPSICLRSAGRIDMGGGPILFEEISFDPWIQASLRKTFQGPKSEADQNLRIFGSDRPITKNDEKVWISSNLSVQSYDTYSGELLLAGRRLGVKVGCAKLFARDNPAPKKLLEFWSAFRVPI